MYCLSLTFFSLKKRTCDCGFVFDLLGVTQYLLSSRRPEEQGEDYREQLLSTAVKPRQTFPTSSLFFCSPLPSLLTNPWCILDDYRRAPGRVRLGFRSVFLLCIVAGDSLVPSLSNLICLPSFGFLVSFGCQIYLLSEVALCLLKILNCKYEIPELLKGNYVNGCVNRFLGGHPVLERPSALPTPKCQEFSLG